MHHNLPPEVTLDNYEAVYGYYRTHQQPRIQALATYAYLAFKYKPVVHYSQKTGQQIKDLRGRGDSFLISVNHPTNTSDQFILAGAAFKSPLRRSIGHMRVLGKDDLFEDEERRKRIDMMGSIPVFRPKDHGMRAVAAAGKRMIDISAQRLKDGDNLAVFVQGEHESQHPDRIDSIHTGIGHIAHHALRRDTPLHLLSIGIAYDGPGDEPKLDHASVYINPPIATENIPGKINDIKNTVHQDLQHAVDSAREHYGTI
ncbi:1-acyl-sn-glycerol-3-phosphate acyltransferase [bacterium]|nr:MAG: 1-acyl-sn-glycerol-3-phosphate acyltransferase [bacterium]